MQKLEAETKAYLKAGDRATAAKFALELQKAKEELAANEQQLQMHETAYGNNLKKIQHANEKLIELREKIQKYDAELKMSAAEAGDRQALRDLRREPDDRLRRDRERHPAEDRSEPRQGARRGRPLEKGIAEIEAEERMQGAAGRAGAQDFEVELGLKSPETTPVAQTAKDLGPAATEKRPRRSRRS